MEKALNRRKKETWYFVDNQRIEGIHGRISGNVSDISGNVSDLVQAQKIMKGELDIESPDYQSSQNDVERFATKGNHTILSHCIILQKNNHAVTWEQAMQFAAIELSKALDKTQTLLIELMKKYPTNHL